MIIQIIGLPGSGKTELAKALKERINAIHLNADEVRATVNSDLGFAPEDRLEQARRMGEMARLISKQGVAPVIVDPVTGTPATTTRVVETTVPVAPAACSSTISGPTISTKFGPVQVQASIDGTGLVCASQGIQWPTADQKSVSINNQAIPLLDQWAVHTGNASFNSISGATYTSKAYKQSLQAIIDGVVG